MHREGAKIFLLSGFCGRLSSDPVLGLRPSQPKAVYPEGLSKSQSCGLGDR